MDPLQWMGAVRMRVQTADKNNTIIHTTPVHQLMYCEAKSCMFVRNKSIKAFLSSNLCFQLKYESSIILLVVSKVVWIRREICTVYKQKQSKAVLNQYISGFCCERTTGDQLFYINYGLNKMAWWICFLQTHSLLLHKMLTDGLEWCGLWCFYQLFGLSFWRHPFTEEDPLVSKWYNAKFLQI